jgi:hypothetical protein
MYIALALAPIERQVLLVILKDRPLRRGPVARGDEVVLARGHELAGLLRRRRPCLAPACRRLEGRRDVGVLLHPLADRRHVGKDLGSDRAHQAGQAPLIPFDAVRANDIIEDPALLGPAPHARLATICHPFSPLARLDL